MSGNESVLVLNPCGQWYSTHIVESTSSLYNLLHLNISLEYFFVVVVVKFTELCTISLSLSIPLSLFLSLSLSFSPSLSLSLPPCHYYATPRSTHTHTHTLSPSPISTQLIEMLRQFLGWDWGWWLTVVVTPYQTSPPLGAQINPGWLIGVAFYSFISQGPVRHGLAGTFM